MFQIVSIKKWGGRWGSNPRHLESQSSALPTELRPPYLSMVFIGVSVFSVNQKVKDCIEILRKILNSASFNENYVVFYQKGASLLSMRSRLRENEFV